MTFTNDFTSEEGQDFEESGKFPVAFGITFTPKVSAIALGILGGIGAIYILLNMVIPAYNTYQEQKIEEASLNEKIEQQSSGEFDLKIQNAERELQQKQALRKEVLVFFGSEKSLDTLLLDINRFFKSRNLDLISFVPEGEVTVIQDSSLGQDVNQKLKRQNINIQMEGGFEQTQSILRDLERLQPLMLVKNITTQTIEDQDKVRVVTSKNNPQVIPQDNKVKTTFLLQVILPVSFGDLPPPAPEPSPQPGESPQPK